MGGFALLTPCHISVSPDANAQLLFSRQAAHLQGTSIKEIYNQTTGNSHNTPSNVEGSTTSDSTTLHPVTHPKEIINVLEAWIALRCQDPIRIHVDGTRQLYQCGSLLDTSPTMPFGTSTSTSTAVPFTYSYTWSWDGDIHAVSDPSVTRPGIAWLQQHCVGTITTRLADHLYALTPFPSTWSTSMLQTITDLIARSVHDALLTLQGPYAFAMCFTIHSIAGADVNFTSIVFGRDRIGRKSLVLRLFDRIHAEQQHEQQPDGDLLCKQGLILSSVAVHLDKLHNPHNGCVTPSDITGKVVLSTGSSTPLSGDQQQHGTTTDSELYHHHPDWIEVNCGGLYSLTLCGSQSPTSSVTTSTMYLQFLPWDYSLFQTASYQKIPEALLFPRRHTPVPLSSLPVLPSPLLTMANTLPLAARLFLYRLAEGVRRQLQSLPDYKSFLHTVKGKTGTTSSTHRASSNDGEDPFLASISAQYHLDQPARVGIMFSGGIDCTVVAALAHFYVPPDEPIDLINVAFQGNAHDSFVDQAAADRAACFSSFYQLQQFAPSRCWRLIKVNITIDELQTYSRVISSLIAPHDTVMDFNIGSILFFGSRGRGTLQPYSKGEDGHQADGSIMSNIQHADKSRMVNGRMVSASVRYGNVQDSTETTRGGGSGSGGVDPNSLRNLTQKEKQQLRKQEMLAKSAIPVQITKELLFQPRHDKEEIKALRQCIGEERRLLASIHKTKRDLLVNLGVIDGEISKQKNFPLEDYTVPEVSNDHPLYEMRTALIQSQNEHQRYLETHAEELYIAKVILEKHPLTPEDEATKRGRAQDAQSKFDAITIAEDEAQQQQQSPPVTYQSQAVILLMGSGADEQLGGYGRHRTAFRNALRHLMHVSLNEDDVTHIRQRELELYGQQQQHSSTNQQAKPSPDDANGDQDDSDGSAQSWLDNIQLEIDDFKSILHAYQRQYNNCMIAELPDHVKQTLQQLALFQDIKKDVLRIWFRNLGRDDRVLSYWGRSCGLPFLDEDIMWFLARFLPDSYQLYTDRLAYYHSLTSSPTDNIDDMNPSTNGVNVSAPTDLEINQIDESRLYFPLSLLCNMNYGYGIGDKMLLRTIAHHLRLTKAGCLQKRAMQFGSRIANRLVPGTNRLRQYTAVIDLVNQQFLFDKSGDGAR